MLNLLVTLNRGYMGPLCTMLRSLAQTNSSECINLYVAHSSLEPSDFTQIKEALGTSDSEVYPIRIDEKLFRQAPTKKRISKETYYRIFAPFYLPRSVDRILYIDPDTVILNSLRSFYSADFGGNLIIGAKHFDGFIDKWNRFRLTLRKSEHYINAGVMLMDIEKMREFLTEEKIFSCIRKNYFRLYLADQDTINILFDGRITVYPESIINLDERCFKNLTDTMPEKKAYEYVEQNTLIVHFDGREKPWQSVYNGKLKKYYDMYCDTYSLSEAGCLVAKA